MTENWPADIPPRKHRRPWLAEMTLWRRHGVLAIELGFTEEEMRAEYNRLAIIASELGIEIE